MDVTHGAWNLWTLLEEFLDTDQSNQPNMHRLVLFCFPVINLRPPRNTILVHFWVWIPVYRTSTSEKLLMLW